VWFTERDRLLNQYFPIRTSVLMQQLKNVGLYPNLAAPVFSKHGGTVPLGHQLHMTGPAGATMYFTTNGKDPRVVGGALEPTASAYATAVTINNTATIKARSLQGGVWSALNEAHFVVEFQLHISEFMADNDGVILDEAGDKEDWVEIYNGSSIPVDMGGMYLSDNLANPKKWQFPAGTTISAGGHLLVWCDEEPGEGPLHANIKLSKSGEALALTHTDAAGNTTIESFTFGAQTTNVSWARLPDGAPGFYSLLTPTPGTRNVPGPGAKINYDAANPAATPSTLTITNTPQIGQTLTTQLTNAAPNQAGLVFFGYEPTQITFPFDGVLLMLYPFADAYSQYTTSPTGTASPSFPVPNSAHLLGTVFLAQAYTVNGKLSSGVAFELMP
jgi:hypothetical protein